MAVFGDTLRQARAHKGVTLREAEQATRISRHYLLALEEEHFDQLPALIYQRGIVKNYATYLDLDQAKLLTLYQGATGEEPPTDAVVIGPGQQIEPAGGIVPNFAVIGFVVVLMAVVFAWGYSAYVATPGDAALTQSPPTVTTVSQDDRFIPSPTAAVPTATRETVVVDTAPKGDETTSSGDQPLDDGVTDLGSASSGESEIFLATQTATAEPVEITLDGDASDPSRDQAVDDEETSTDGATTSDGQESQYSFSTRTDVYLTVVVDSVVQWEGNLAAGRETNFLVGDTFLVTFSGADAISVVDGSGAQREINGPTVELP